MVARAHNFRSHIDSSEPFSRNQVSQALEKRISTTFSASQVAMLACSGSTGTAQNDFHSTKRLQSIAGEPAYVKYRLPITPLTLLLGWLCSRAVQVQQVPFGGRTGATARGSRRLQLQPTDDQPSRPCLLPPSVPSPVLMIPHQIDSFVSRQHIYLLLVV